MQNEWTLVSLKLPEIGQDVLIYSTIMKGYAVARIEGFSASPRWINSTNGQEFPPRSVTHWTDLPAPPVEASIGRSGFESYSSTSSN